MSSRFARSGDPRPRPFLAAEKVSTIYPGSAVEVRCWVPGQMVHGSDVWFMLGGGLEFAPRVAIEPSAAVPSCLE